MASEDKQWSQDDPSLKSPHPSTYPFEPLPTPANDDAKVRVSLINTVPLEGPKNVLTAFAKEGERETLPCFSVLIQKQGFGDILWDLGMREDAENATEMTKETFKAFVPQPGIGSMRFLKENGYDASKIKMVVLSHRHFDHTGDFETLPRPHPPILLGHGALEPIGKGEPDQHRSPWPSKWLKDFDLIELPSVKDGEWDDRTADLGLTKTERGGKERKWEKLGCFEHAVDWFGDGSLWFIDTPGHCEGHLMALARVTTSPPSYILLSGDAAHHRTQYLPVPGSDSDKDERSPIPVVDGKPSLAIDPPVLAHTIGQMSRMHLEENVMVLMAHDLEADGLLPEYPNDLSEWVDPRLSRGTTSLEPVAERKRMSQGVGPSSFYRSLSCCIRSFSS